MKPIFVALLALCVVGSVGAQKPPTSRPDVDPNLAWKCSFECDRFPTRNNPNSAWDYETKTDIAGKTTEYATSGNLVIRCSRSCDVFFTLDRGIVADQTSVRVKFNAASVRSFGVSLAQSHDGLFFTAPMAILKAIRDNGGYMTIEYSPWEKVPETETFGVWALPPSILSRITKAEPDLRKSDQQREIQACYDARWPQWVGLQSDLKKLCERDVNGK